MRKSEFYLTATGIIVGSALSIVLFWAVLSLPAAQTGHSPQPDSAQIER